MTESSPRGWTEYTYGTNGSSEFVADATAPGSGIGALQLRTPASGDITQYYRDADYVVPVGQINLSYASRRIAGSDTAAPAYVLGIDTNGDNTDEFYAWYEPVYNDTDETNYNQWNTWQVNQSSKFWSKSSAAPGTGAWRQFTLADVVAMYPTARVIDYTINQGSGNEEFITLVDNVVTPGFTYDFEPNVPADTTAPSIPTAKFFDGNNNERPHTSWTQTKNFKFQLSTPEEDNATGYQVRYWNDIDGSGYKGEGNAWSRTIGADGVYADQFTQGEGIHYFSFRARDEAGKWSAYSDAFKIGYDQTNPVVEVTNIHEGDILRPNTDGKIVVRGNFNDAVSGANYAQIQLVYKGNNAGFVTKSGAVNDGILAEFDASSLAEGSEYYISYNAADVAGNVVEWKRINFTLDKTAPTTPIISAPGARTWHKTAPITNSWSEASDTYGVDYYQIAYNYDDGDVFGGTNTCEGVTIPGASGFIGCRNVNGLSRSHQPSVSEQGGVTIWVRAIDKAGNAGQWSKSVHYYYDQTAPVGDISFPSDDSTVQTVDGKLKVNGTVVDNVLMNRVGVQLVKPGVSGHIQYLYHHMVNQNPGSWNVEFDAAELNLVNGQYGLNLYFTDMAGNTSTKQIQLKIDNPAPVVNGENFNTNNDANYKGINVGFNIANFSNVSGVTVSLYHESETDPFVFNAGTAELYKLINDQKITQHSTPFYTIGTARDIYWTFGDYEWSHDSKKPAKAVVTVTGTNALGDTVTEIATLDNLTEPNGVTFASVLPPEVIQKPVSPKPSSPSRTPNSSPDTDEEDDENNGDGISILDIIGNAANTPIAPIIGGIDDNAQNNDGADSNNSADDNGDVLGEQDQAGTPLEDTGEVLGLMDHKWFGIAWYWFLIILGGIIGAWLMLAAAIRRHRGEEV